MNTTRLSSSLAALALCALWSAALPRPARGVILLSPSNPQNIYPDEGDSPGNLGHFVGAFHVGGGIPIAPHYFITATHLGGVPGPNGSTFFINTYPGNTPLEYKSTHAWNSPNSDLTIFRIDGTFPSNLIAPLWDDTSFNSEIGPELVVLGRGTTRDAEVNLSSQLKGWKWGGLPLKTSWGQNFVAGYADQVSTGDNMALYFNFDDTGGPNEASLSLGDSGGGVFLYDEANDRWELAAINWAANGFFNFSATDTGAFYAALFNREGMYEKFGTTWYEWPNGPGDQPGGSYATRIVPQLTWIDGIINDAYGDMDDDGDVDDKDIDILWHIIRGSVPDDPGNNDFEDLTGDGFANEKDVDYMLANLLTAGPNRRYGDANLSGGAPEITDYNLWRTGTGGWAGGDFDGTGGVPELNDYNLWRTGPTAFPTTVGPNGDGGPGAPGGAPLVPEPETLTLMALALLALLARGARARRAKPQASVNPILNPESLDSPPLFWHN